MRRMLGIGAAAVAGFALVGAGSAPAFAGSLTPGSAVQLAQTGADATPWLIAAGVLVFLGIIVVIVGQVMRMRRASRPPKSGDGGGEGPISPDGL
ncbi:LPXTG cell wall anchor domain-containing protein [Compostimonas suwonensis]|uniref:LPXTG-motif cell wall-anchored protein n=1 Tax=Compostimonas suwonensis TaxID=1048394 RepID=A0A2M9C385_9MICO|nr:LPXTG cell wall anchor domain-containing protein [Compostimonas suwonensis]PJJ64978.1 LPXTG-motif cell wall-anchored protein [Compostimonas suwonensis]